MAGPSNSDCTKIRSTRQASSLNEGCHKWLGEQGEGEGDDMMEMGDVKESVEIGARCTNHLTTLGRL